MEKNLTHERNARHQLLELACEVRLYRVVGRRYFFDLAEHAHLVARAAVHERVPLSTPITDLFTDQREKYGGGETLGWYYRRAYGSSDFRLDPQRFFTIAYTNNFVTILSRAVCGAGGEIRINDRSVGDIFRCAGNDTPGSYSRWASNEHPAGASPQLLRMDNGGYHGGQMLLQAEDLHPCQGSLYFGEPAQESEQLAAFCRLEEHVCALFAEKMSSKAQRAEAEKRAATIIVLALAPNCPTWLGLVAPPTRISSKRRPSAGS